MKKINNNALMSLIDLDYVLRRPRTPDMSIADHRLRTAALGNNIYTPNAIDYE